MVRPARSNTPNGLRIRPFRRAELARVRENGDQRRMRPRLESRCVFRINYSRPAENRPVFVGMDRVVELGPVHQIGADRMAPGHVAPVDPFRVVLEEQVVFAVVMDQAVRVVGPVGLRREMKLRPVRFLIQPIGDIQHASHLPVMAHRVRDAVRASCDLDDAERAVLAFQARHVSQYGSLRFWPTAWRTSWPSRAGWPGIARPVPPELYAQIVLRDGSSRVVSSVPMLRSIEQCGRC